MKNFALKPAALACVAALGLGALSQGAIAQPTAAQQNAIHQYCRADISAHCRRVAPGGKDALACLQNNAEKLSSKCQDAVFATMPVEPDTAAAPAAAAPPASASAPPPAATGRRAMIVSAPPPAARPAHRALKHAPAATVAAATAAVEPPPPPTSSHAPQATAAKPKPGTKPGTKPGAKLAARPEAEPRAAAKPAQQAHAPASHAAVVARTCKHDLARYCRNLRPGAGRDYACLSAHRVMLSPNCRAAITVVGRAH